jgi:hypothetical protein
MSRDALFVQARQLVRERAVLKPSGVGVVYLWSPIRDQQVGGWR